MINYTRERTYEVDDNDDKGDEKKEVNEEKCREVKIIKLPCVKSPASRDDIWPRRMRTDITELYH